MNGHPRQQPKHLPYSQWSQHRANNGLIYLSHPVTGEVKWLWSRHHDPKTSNDYLVNTITSNRVWVTAQNEHLCPSKPRTTQAAASQPVQGTSKLTAFPFSALKSAPPGNSTDRSTNASNTSKYRELEAPKSLGLTADEILMQAEGGRRYIYNKKTKNSRWLDRPSEKISADQKNASIKNGSSKLSSFPYAPERKERGTVTSDSNPTPKAASSHASESQSWQAFSHERNGSAHQRTNSQTRGTANGYVHRSKPLSADEAALSIQRAFRASVVRRGNLVDKWRLITKVLDEVSDTISKGKYDIDYLRGLPNRSLNGEERGHAVQRLLELDEFLSQRTMVVDAVESAGNQLLRGKRKESVKWILKLQDEVIALRKTLKS